MKRIDLKVFSVLKEECTFPFAIYCSKMIQIFC